MAVAVVVKVVVAPTAMTMVVAAVESDMMASITIVASMAVTLLEELVVAATVTTMVVTAERAVMMVPMTLGGGHGSW